MPKRELVLNVNILRAGFHGGTWRAPASAPDSFVDVARDGRAARIAERGAFAVFLADVPALAGPAGLPAVPGAGSHHRADHG